MVDQGLADQFAISTLTNKLEHNVSDNKPWFKHAMLSNANSCWYAQLFIGIFFIYPTMTVLSFGRCNA